MFERQRHSRKPGLCFDSLIWCGNYLECKKCRGVIAVQYDGTLNVLDNYKDHEDKIYAYARAVPNPNFKEREDEWGAAKDALKIIREDKANTQKKLESLKKENDRRRLEHPERYDEDGDPLPFDDIVFDNEDSAAGDLNLSEYGISEENMEETVE